MLSDEELMELYRDKTFPGAYSGARNFQMFLKMDKNENVSLRRIYDLLKKEPHYIISQRPIRKFPRRKFDVGGYGQLLQTDLAFMFEKNGYKFILVVVDVFSQKIWAVPLKDKSTREVRPAFEKIFEEANTPITEIQSDQGTEFTGLREFFKQKKILFRLKYGKNKASWAEHAIYLIKRKMYQMMRAEISDNWLNYLPYAVNALNQRHLRALGFMSPSDIKSELDDALVRKAQEENNVAVYHQPNYKEQNQNQEDYKNSTNPFQVGQHVYLDNKEQVFNKSFFSQVKYFPHLLSFFSKKKI